MTERQRRAVFARVLAMSAAVYVSYGAGVVVITWSLAARGGDLGTVLGAMLFLLAPCVLAAPAIGVALDRELTTPWLSRITVAAAVALALALAVSGPSYPLMCAVLVVIGALRELANILVRKRLPTLFEAELLVRANSLHTIARQLGYLGGTLLGGTLLEWAPLAVALAAVLAFAMGSGVLSHALERSAARAAARPAASAVDRPAASAAWPFGARVRRGARLLARSRVSLWLALIVVQQIISELLQAVLAVFVVVRISDNPLHLSAIANVLMVGSIVGGLALAPLRAARSVPLILAGFLAGQAAAIAWFALTSTFLAAMVAYFWVGVLFQGRTLCQALIQARFEPAHQAKLQSAVSALSGAASVLVIAVLAGLAEVASPVAVHLGIAAVLVVASAASAASVRGARATRRAR